MFFYFYNIRFIQLNNLSRGVHYNKWPVNGEVWCDTRKKKQQQQANELHSQIGL